MSPICADSIADSVLTTFDALPSKYKPRKLEDGRREWVPLAGIVLRKGHESENLTCATLATGMKCLPLSKVPQAKGNVLHDWHAEILAIRGFNRWIVDECAELARKGFRKGGEGENDWIRWREQGRAEGTKHEPPFELQEDVSIHMYCSEAPCGDASMELVMQAQEDDTPWKSQVASDAGMLGRGHFDQLGVVRRKPARPDAPVTLSKSCSDKIAMKQVTGLLGGVASMLVHPRGTYLSTIVLPESQYVATAVKRSFGAEGRNKYLSEWEDQAGRAFRHAEVKTTSREFAFSRRVVGPAPVPSNLSALYTPRKQETLINGVLQGRKQLDLKAASCVSRRSLWKGVLDVAVIGGLTALVNKLQKPTYRELKESNALQKRREAKQHAKEVALKGWTKNAEDHDWGLEQ